MDTLALLGLQRLYVALHHAQRGLLCLDDGSVRLYGRVTRLQTHAKFS